LGAYVDKYGKDYDEIMAASKLQHDHMMATCHMCDTHIEIKDLTTKKSKAMETGRHPNNFFSGICGTTYTMHIALRKSRR